MATPAAWRMHEVPGITEVRPGTYVYNDRATAALGACEWDECALSVVATVVSTSVGIARGPARDENAVDTLLQMIAADREWNEGAARAKLLQMFEAVGLEDPGVSAQRRKLSLLLFG